MDSFSLRSLYRIGLNSEDTAFALDTNLSLCFQLSSHSVKYFPTHQSTDFGTLSDINGSKHGTETGLEPDVQHINSLPIGRYFLRK